MNYALPIRVKLDFTRIVTAQYRYVWYPVLRCSFSRISDLKTNVCNKYNLSYNDTKLFLSGALLREDDTVLLLREDDVIQILQRGQSYDGETDHRQSKKRKRKSALSSELDVNSASEDPRQITDNLRNSDSTEDYELQPPPKIKKKDKRKGKRISTNENTETVRDMTDETFMNLATTSSNYTNDTIVFEKKVVDKKKKKNRIDANASPAIESSNKMLSSIMQSTPFESVTIGGKSVKDSTGKEILEREKHGSGNVTVDDDGLLNKKSAKKTSESSLDNYNTSISIQSEANNANQSGNSSQKRKRKRKRRRKKSDTSEFLPGDHLNFSIEPISDQMLPTPELKADKTHIRFDLSSPLKMNSDSDDDRLFISLPTETSVDAGFSSLITNDKSSESVLPKFDTPFAPQLTPVRFEAVRSNDIVSTQKLAQKTAPRSLYSQQAKRSGGSKNTEMLSNERIVSEICRQEMPEILAGSDAEVSSVPLSSNTVGSSFVSPYSNNTIEIENTGFPNDSVSHCESTLSKGSSPSLNLKTSRQSGPVTSQHPIISQQPSHVISQKPNPVISQQPSHVISQQPSPIISQQQSPIISYKSSPVIYETSSPGFHQKPIPVILRKSGRVKPFKSSPAAPHRSNPTIFQQPSHVIPQKSSSSTISRLQNGKAPELSSSGCAPQNQEEKKNYDVYPLLSAMPLVGSTVAFKLLELSDLYCPEVSDWKEGRIVGTDCASENIVTIELLKEEIKKTKTGKFENIYESDSENENQHEIIKSITRKWTELIEPRLVLNCIMPDKCIEV